MATYTDKNGNTHVILASGAHYVECGGNIVRLPSTR
jgi:hypothetical protein